MGVRGEEERTSVRGSQGAPQLPPARTRRRAQRGGAEWEQEK